MKTNLSDVRVFNWNEQISVQESTINVSPYHRHSFLEFAYVTHGSVVHTFQDESIIVREGDFFMVNYDEAHSYSPDGNNDFSVINILFRPEFIDASLKGCRGFQDLAALTSIGCNYFNLEVPPTTIIYHDRDGEVLLLFRKLLREYKEKEPKHLELMRCYLTELLIITLRKVYRANSAIPATDQTFNDVLEYINANYAGDIRLGDISAKMGYTQPYLSSLFSKRLGITFSKYLQSVRISKACEMLANSDRNIEEISAACGYNDIKFFRRLFREKTKLSPSAFRARARMNSIL